MTQLINRAAAGFSAGVVMTAGIVAITGITWSADVAPRLVASEAAAETAPETAPETETEAASEPETEPETETETETEAREVLVFAAPTAAIDLTIDCIDLNRDCNGVKSRGLPAISPDGKTIADLFSRDDGGRGNPNFHIRIYRATDGSPITEIPLLTADEYEQTGGAARALDALVPLARRRARRAVAKLRAAHYEPLRLLAPAAAELRARFGDLDIDVAGETVTARDRATGWAVLQATYPRGPAEVDPDSDDVCAVVSAHDHALYLSRDEKTLVSKILYIGGPCWCDSEEALYARPLAAVPRNLRSK